MKKKVLQFLLKLISRLIIAKYRPTIIGITGSVGKTSTKEAISSVLSYKHSVRSNIKNYNNEFGLPLTIIGAVSAGGSMLAWLGLLISSLRLLVLRVDYPKFLVLEMGVDHPGDMDYLNSIVNLKIAVLTTIGVSHLANFSSAEKIKLEKKKIFNTLDPKSGWGILNYDNEKTREISEQIDCRVLTYGLNPRADVSAHSLDYSFKDDESLSAWQGMSFKIKYQGSYIPVLLSGAISKSSAYAALAAASVGFAFGMNGIEISQALAKFQPPKGRMNLLEGINGSMIIDDTYNSSPQSSINALETLEEIKLSNIKRRWVVLGDMLELGTDSEKGHTEVGQKLAELKHVNLVTLGQEIIFTAIAAAKAGVKETDIYRCNNHQEIIELLQRELRTDDIVLVKGSQGMRMEKVVAEIIKDSSKAGELLVRQDKEWK